MKLVKRRLTPKEHAYQDGYVSGGKMLGKKFVPLNTWLFLIFDHSVNNENRGRIFPIWREKIHEEKAQFFTGKHFGAKKKSPSVRAFLYFPSALKVLVERLGKGRIYFF
ncbi:MAG: hypothetical protein LBR53_06365 [Deltaproteobacteria bacterium]|jgi:hypothetical protein|nr:hypothetical protein [Deltaproteobacteria bacterium]